MAVQQNKKSPSKRGMHRSHNAVAAPGTAVEATTGEVHLRHHIRNAATNTCMSGARPGAFSARIS